MLMVSVLTKFKTKSLHVSSIHRISGLDLMYMFATVLLRVDWTARHPNLLSRGPHSKWPFVFHACGARDSEWENLLHDVMFLSKARTLATYL